MKRLLVLSAILFAASARCSALLDSGADFLKLGADARASALGDAQSADPAADFFHNPAALAFVKSYPANVARISHAATVQDSMMEYVSYAFSSGNLGAFGVSGMLFHVKPIPVTLASPEPIGELVWRDFAASFGWGKKISRRLAVGASVKYIYRFTENPIFGKTVGTAAACDAGAMYRVFPDEKLYLGVAAQNIGTKVSYDPPEPKNDELPRFWKLGARWMIFSDGDDRVFLYSDAVSASYDKIRPQYGCELSFGGGFFLRGAYISKEGNIEGLSAGAGFKGNYFFVDLASRPAGDMGRTSIASVGFEW